MSVSFALPCLEELWLGRERVAVVSGVWRNPSRALSLSLGVAHGHGRGRGLALAPCPSAERVSVGRSVGGSLGPSNAIHQVELDWIAQSFSPTLHYLLAPRSTLHAPRFSLRKYLVRNLFTYHAPPSNTLTNLLVN